MAEPETLPMRRGTIRTSATVRIPVRGGEPMSRSEAYQQWQRALRLAETAERVYNGVVEREAISKNP